MSNLNKISESAKKTGTAATAALKDVFQGDFHVGAALSLDQILGKEPEALEVVTTHFNSITPENILKWEEVHPEPDRYNFEAADRFVALGEKHRMHIIGHTMVWWHQTPDWVFQDASGKALGREALLERMREHIGTVMGRYRGRIHGWDVVNESIMADGSWRKSRWYEIIGEDYVQKAFEFAREADPQAELYYNEYDYEHRPKAQGVVQLIKSLLAKGVKIDGIGIQGHWFVEHPPLPEIEAYVEDLARLGPKLMITELDLSVLPYYPIDSRIVPLSSFDAETQRKFNPYPNGMTPAAEEKLARRYAELFSFFRKHRFSRVTFWGVHDGQSWRNYWPITGRLDYPMLFDRRCRPKPALDAIVAAGRPAR